MPCYQRLRGLCTGPLPGGRWQEKVITTLPSCPSPEVALLGRLLLVWRTQILAYFDAHGLSNGGGTDAIDI